LPLTTSDLAAAAVAENQEEMFSAVYDLMLGLGEAAVLQNNPATPFLLKQAAVKGALGHVCGFLRRFRDIEEEGLNRPLESLLTALVDLEGGTQPELLRPRRAGHAPSMSYGKQALVIHAAFALDALMGLGLSQAAAAHAVARQIELAGIPLTGRKPVTARRVVDWRDRLNAGPGAMPAFAVETWRRLQAQKRSDGSLQPVPEADQIVLQHFRLILDRLATNLKKPPS
jgi:hypothetical protein